MITDEDIQKLNKTFATKDELSEEIGKLVLYIQSENKSLRSELKSDIAELKELMLTEFSKIHDQFSHFIKLIYSHEIRITKLENKENVN